MELAERVRLLESAKFDSNEDKAINWIVQALEEGDIAKARVDFEGQGDKFEGNRELNEMLQKGLYDPKNLSPKDRWRKMVAEED